MTEADLRPFQPRFIREAFAPGVEIAALSLPRGGGKTSLLGYLAARALTTGDPLHVPGASNVLVTGSLKQARTAFRVPRAILGEDGYGYEDSNQNIKALHRASLARVEAHACNSRTAWAWLGCRLILVDESAVVPRELWDAITTSAGKTETTIVVCGTLAPADPRVHWWPKLVKAGSGSGVHVTALQGDAETWDTWPTIRKANPLVNVNPRLRATLKRERAEARRDEHARARFLSFRLNVPTADESTMLVPYDQWERVLRRPVPPREGAAVLGLDLGAARS